MADRSGVAKEERDRLAIEPREVYEVDRIDPPLAGLALRHKGLRSMQCFRNVDLRQISRDSGLPKPPKHRFVSRLVNPSDISH